MALRGIIGDLRALAQLGDTLRELERTHGKQARADRAAGVIELVEVAPGVYAPPKRPPLPKHVRATINEMNELGQVLGEVHRAWKR